MLTMHDDDGKEEGGGGEVEDVCGVRERIL